MNNITTIVSSGILLNTPSDKSTNELVNECSKVSVNTFFDNSTDSYIPTCNFFNTCNNIFSNQYIESINCNCFCEYNPPSKLELEEIFDDNNNKIIFMINNSIDNSFIYTPLIFYSNSTFITDKILSCNKTSPDKSIILSLIFKYDIDNKNRILLNGFMYEDEDNKKYNIIEFNVESKIKINDITYENIAVCKYCNI